MNTQLSEDEWQQLIFALDEDNKLCVLILGMGLSTTLVDGREITLTESLSRELASRLPDDWIDDTSNLPHVAGQYQKFKRSRQALLVAVEQFFRTQREPNPLLTKISELPFHLIINGAHDNLLAQAFARRHGGYRQELYNFQKEQRDCNYRSEDPDPMIYHLFGHVNTPESMVLTAADTVEFIRQVVQKERKIPNSILCELMPTKTFLFLGFNFENWYLRMLLYALGLKGDEDSSLSMGVQREGVFLKNTTRVFFGNRFKLNIVELPVEAFVDELHSRYRQAFPDRFNRLDSGNGNPARQKQSHEIPAFVIYDGQDEMIFRQFEREIRAISNKYGLKILAAQPGDSPADIHDKLGQSHFIFMLVTSRLAANDFLFYEVLPVALLQDGATVVPILARSFNFMSLPDMQNRPILPRDRRAINEWPDENMAWVHIVSQIEEMLKNP